MNYYIQGDAANADQIKAAFEAKGFIPRIAPMYYGSESVLFFTGTDNYIYETPSPWVMDIIKTHPDYQELELPIEPMFKVGDWVVANDIGIVSQITKVINDTDEYGEYHAYEHTNGYFAACFENEYHLWTIADAKDGDVLVTTNIRSCPFIYRKTTYNNDLVYYYAGIDGNGNFTHNESLHHFGPASNVAPASKEQRDLLFAKMKEAGYTWDGEKKELKKIPKHYDIKNFHVGMPVLVRDNKGEEWRHTAFSHITSRFDENKFAAGCTYWCQCIPFNDDTKHLLGNTDMCDECYINW